MSVTHDIPRLLCNLLPSPRPPHLQHLQLPVSTGSTFMKICRIAQNRQNSVIKAPNQKLETLKTSGLITWLSTVVWYSLW